MPAIFLAMKMPETPWYAKLFAAVTVVYALSPIDLISDFIPLLGYIDDLVFCPCAFNYIHLYCFQIFKCLLYFFLVSEIVTVKLDYGGLVISVRF